MTESIRIQDFPLWERLKTRRVPLGFDLEVTARCPNHCRHCYINIPAGDIDAQQKELSAAEFVRIAEEAVALGSLWCLLTGGEPLLRPDFPEIYLGLKRLGLLVSVFTAGMLITEEHARLFREYPPRDIEITVYGVTAGTYDAVTRHPGSFVAFRRGLDRLQAAGLKLRLKAMALRTNLHEFPAIARFCREHTKDYFRFDPTLHLRYDGDPCRNEEIRRERLSPPEVVALECSDPERFSMAGKECAALSCVAVPQSAAALFRCGAGKSSFTVGYDGTFRACSALVHPGFTGDLKRVPLVEAWESARGISTASSSRPEFLLSCSGCNLVPLCSWCPAHAHLETGELDAPVEYFCRIAHARLAEHQCAGQLSCGLTETAK